jgi:ABC-2 type transport system permease protein
MNTQSNTVPNAPIEAQVVTNAAVAATRPLYWSIRRELWENRSVFIAPIALAFLFLLGCLFASIRYHENWRPVFADPVNHRAAIDMPYHAAAFLILLTAFFTGAIYCLDALYGERRDRSVLFWKSLPVSDLTTVLAKASIPLAVLPLVTFAIIVATQFVLFLFSTAIALGNGLSAATLWAQLPLWKMWLSLLCALVASALWYAPIYGWLLLVSSYARRATFLWAILPLFAICVVEKVAFNTIHFANLLRFRLIGWYTQAFVPLVPGGVPPADPLTQITPWKFLSTPELWIGLAVASVFLAIAIRLRRSREPI